MVHGRGATWSRIRRGAAASVLAAACAGGSIAVSGCGSSTVANVVDPVAKAATISNHATGMRMTMTMQLNTLGLPKPITATGQGAFNTPDRTGSFTMAMDFGSIPQVAQVLGTNTLRLQELLFGTTVYLKFPSALASKIPSLRKPWLKISLAQAASASGIPGLSSLTSNPASSDPSQFLRYLRAESGHVRKVGTTTVDGRQTTQYKAQINLDRVPAAFPASARPQVRQALTTLRRLAHIRLLPVNVWVDARHLVRKMQLAFQESVSGQPLALRMAINIPEYGPQAVPAPPPASQVQDISGLAGANTNGTP